MGPITALRIVRELSVRNNDGTATRGARQLVAAIPQLGMRPWAQHLLRDLTRYLVDFPQPITGETTERAHLAADWLIRARAVTADGGLSYGYFPFQQTAGWRSSYPETTGYTVPTLLRYGVTFDRPDAVQAALAMASFVVSSQLPSGAVYGGMAGASKERIAVAFNTGMGLMGLLAAYRHTRLATFADAARRAARFLVNDIGEDGHFRSHGPSVHPHPVKTFTCLCAWPLYEAGRELGMPTFSAEAVRVGDRHMRRIGGLRAVEAACRESARTLQVDLRAALRCVCLGYHLFDRHLDKGRVRRRHGAIRESDFHNLGQQMDAVGRAEAHSVDVKAFENVQHLRDVNAA